MIPSNLRELLQRDEGCRLKVYMDSTGHPTIGYGRALDVKGISLAEAELMLDNDIQDFRANVFVEYPWIMRLSEVRQAVFISMAFNVGLAGLKGFQKFLAAAEAGDWDTAAAHGLDSKWHRQIGLRAERLMAQLRSGEWDGGQSIE